MLTLVKSAALLYKTQRDQVNALILAQIICYIYVRIYDVMEEVLTSTLMKNFYYVYWKHAASAYTS